jgi:hypothetical protein
MIRERGGWLSGVRLRGLCGEGDEQDIPESLFISSYVTCPSFSWGFRSSPSSCCSGFWLPSLWALNARCRPLMMGSLPCSTPL